MRRQLTLFVPPSESALVEDVRRRLDPRQHAIIRAHVTLCREDELEAWEEIEARLRSLPPLSLTMRFGGPEVLPDGCVLLRPTEGIEQYDRLRRLILGPAAGGHGAHLTLLHPRHAAGVTYDLGEIGRLLAGFSATFRAVAVIEQREGGAWEARQEHGVSSSA